MVFSKSPNKSILLCIVLIFSICIVFVSEFILNIKLLPSFKSHLNYVNYENVSKKDVIICTSQMMKYLSPFSNISETNPFTLIKSHPNFPSVLLISSDLPSLLPDISSIRWTGISWQESNKENPKFLIYSAHLDKLPFTKYSNGTSLYILGLSQGSVKPENYFCQMYFHEAGSVITVPVITYNLIDWQSYSVDRLQPYLLTCLLPLEIGLQSVPAAVSLVTTPCSIGTNLLQITGSEAIKLGGTTEGEPTVGVCGPALYYYNEDFSVRLVEWIELLYMIGVAKVILYKVSVHENLEKVLQYYENRDMIKLISFHYPPPYLDEPALRRIWTETKRKEMFALENIYFTDCILRFKDHFDYLGHFDPDEMPVLLKHKSLGKLMHFFKNLYLGKPLPAFFQLKWKVFYPDLKLGNHSFPISNTTYMLNHNIRVSRILSQVDDNSKSIYDTKQVRAVFSHRPLLYVDGSSHRKSVSVDPSIAYTAHFRHQTCGKQCQGVALEEERFFMDRGFELIKRVRNVLSELKFGYL